VCPLLCAWIEEQAKLATLRVERAGVARRRVTHVNYTSRPRGAGRIAIDSHPSQHYHCTRLREAPPLEHA